MNRIATTLSIAVAFAAGCGLTHVLRPALAADNARAIRLYPLYHPAAALYTPSTLEILRADFHRIPELLAQGAPEQPVSEDVETEEVPQPEEPSTDPGLDHDAPESSVETGEPAEIVQLGLF